MTESARLAAVIIRIISCAMIAVAALSVIMQLILFARSPGTMPEFARGGVMAVGLLVYLLPGIALYRYSRVVGAFLARGLE